MGLRGSCIKNNNIKLTLYAPCADVVNDRPAPHSSGVLSVRLDTKLVDHVGLQIVDDRVTRRAGLVVPLPVLLTIPHSIVSETKKKDNRAH